MCSDPRPFPSHQQAFHVSLRELFLSGPDVRSERRIAMSGKQHSLHEIVQILGEGLDGKSSKREVCRRHGISEQTFYRWLKLYPRAKAAHEALAGHDKPGYLRLLQALSDPSGAEDDFPGTDEIDDRPEEPADGPTWEQLYPEGKNTADREILTRPTVAYDTAFRDRDQVVKIHGRLPRGEFEFVQIALPKDLHRRLKKAVDGSLNQAMIGLVRFALDALDRDHQNLHLFDASLPKPQLGWVCSSS